MQNTVGGILRYGSEAFQKMPRASDFTSGNLKVYWAPGQYGNWTAPPGAPFSPSVYINPVGWPIANHILSLPMVVRFFLDVRSNIGTVNGRTVTWFNLAQNLQSQLQAKYKNLYVLLVQGNNNIHAPPANSPQLNAFSRWMINLCPIDFAGHFLGTDVFNICISQDYGLTELGGDSQYYDNPFGGEGGPTVVEPSANYLADTAGPIQAYPKFRRFTTNVYHDIGIDPADTHGQIIAYPNVNATWEAWWNNVVTNSGKYAAVGLKNFDFHYGGQVNYSTTDVNFFISEVKKHFGLS